MFTVLCWRSVVRVAYLTHPSNLLTAPPTSTGSFVKLLWLRFLLFGRHLLLEVLFLNLPLSCCLSWVKHWNFIFRMLCLCPQQPTEVPNDVIGITV